MSSTFFTASPHWRWLITAYFFLGGLAGGSYFVATMMHLLAKNPDRRMVRLGYLVAFPLVCLCGLVLTVDLGRSERFWHMLVQSETFRPMIKMYSPMSSGAWVLLLFSGCAFLSFLAALAEQGRPDWPILRRLDPTAWPGRLLTVIGALLGLYLAGYTGVLLSVTNRPIWADTTFLGLTFLVSGASTSAAFLILLGSWIEASPRSVHSLERFDRSALILEVLALAALMTSLGRVAAVWLNGWGLLLAAMVLGGIALPLVLAWRRPGSDRPGWIGPVLVLFGGLLLRVVIVFSSDRL
jgi:formate-dependent nitrite reductase membrane component NrfD